MRNFVKIYFPSNTTTVKIVLPTFQKGWFSVWNVGFLRWSSIDLPGLQISNVHANLLYQYELFEINNWKPTEIKHWKTIVKRYGLVCVTRVEDKFNCCTCSRVDTFLCFQVIPNSSGILDGSIGNSDATPSPHYPVSEQTPIGHPGSWVSTFTHYYTTSILGDMSQESIPLTNPSFDSSSYGNRQLRQVNFSVIIVELQDSQEID